MQKKQEKEIIIIKLNISLRLQKSHCVPWKSELRTIQKKPGCKNMSRCGSTFKVRRTTLRLRCSKKLHGPREKLINMVTRILINGIKYEATS
jgi:hypothetical protein